MEDPRWLRLVTVGLVLAALAVGYFLLTGRFNTANQAKPANRGISVSPSPVSQAIPTGSPEATGGPGSVNPSPTPAATPDSRRNLTILPATGYMQAILGLIAAGVMISGWGLRKYPD